MNEYVIAKYIRLSMDDAVTESLSIPNQRLLLDRRIDELDIPDARVLEFVDNGHSGVNMERPAVQEMLGLVRSGGINLIIIKDFSRFSRNEMDSGYFIEQVFPLYQVRFISVSDAFDSDDYKGETGGIDVAFKFLMNQYYSADLSAKVKSAMRLKMKRGENVVAKCVYGYAKIDGKWEPDGIASEVVRKIYGCALDGCSPAQIRDILFAEQIPTPQEYLEIGRGKEIVPSCLWEARAVTRILTNEQYKGTYVSGKQEQKAIGSHSKDWVDKSEWIIIPERHTPIIAPDVFDRIQEIMKAFLTSEVTPKTARHCQSGFTPTEHTPRTLPYGYRFDAGGGWVLDETASKAVRRIFGLAQQGVHEAEIAETLKSEQIPAPLEYRQMKNGKDITPTFAWRANGVRDILRDAQYTGAQVCGKFGRRGDGTHYRTHGSDWIIIPGKIPAIVGKDEFDAVAEIMANRGKRPQKQRDYLLRGNIVKCGCCGYAMSYDRISDPVFRCYHTAADPNADCHKLKIVVSELDEVVLAVIRKKAEQVLKCADLSKLRRKTVDEQQLADCEKDVLKNAEERQRLYERFVLGELDLESYQRLKDEWNSRLERLNQQIAAMKSELDAGKITPRSVAAAKSAVSETANNRELAETLIETVKVFPDKRIEVNWKISEFGIAE